MRSQNLKNNVVATIGTALEWAEFSFYGYLANLFAELFFPNSIPSIGVLKAFAIFAIGYVFRPLGAVFFGHIGDKFGRNVALVSALSLMGAATFCIGCLPTYEEIGFWAPVGLVVCRLLQSISISGEYNGAGIFIIENCPHDKHCLAGSWVSTAAAFGLVIGGFAAYIVSQPLIPEWAWRVPFIIGGILCFVGLLLRLNLKSPITKPAQEKTPLFEVLRHHKRGLIFTAAVSAFIGVNFYTCNVYMATYIKDFAHVPNHQAKFYIMYAEIIVMFLTPLMAYWADLTNPYRHFCLSLLGAAISAPIVFMLAGSSEPLLITIGMMIFGISNAAVCGPMIKLLFDQFPKEVRYTGISVGWSFSAAIFSGTAPMVSQFLAQQCHWQMGPSFYVTLTALCTYFIIQKSNGITSFVPKRQFARA